MSETDFISKPFMFITKFREGMGSFWGGVNPEEIQAVYSIFPLTHTNIQKPRGKSCRSTRRQSLKVAHPPYQEQRAQIVDSFDFVREATRFFHKERCKFSWWIWAAQRCDLRRKNVSTLARNYRKLAQLTENVDFVMYNPHLWELND